MTFHGRRDGIVNGIIMLKDSFLAHCPQRQQRECQPHPALKLCLSHGLVDHKGYKEILMRLPGTEGVHLKCSNDDILTYMSMGPWGFDQVDRYMPVCRRVPWDNTAISSEVMFLELEFERMSMRQYEADNTGSCSLGHTVSKCLPTVNWNLY